MSTPKEDHPDDKRISSRDIMAEISEKHRSYIRANPGFLVAVDGNQAISKVDNNLESGPEKRSKAAINNSLSFGETKSMMEPWELPRVRRSRNRTRSSTPSHPEAALPSKSRSQSPASSLSNRREKKIVKRKKSVLVLEVVSSPSEKKHPVIPSVDEKENLAVSSRLEKEGSLVLNDSEKDGLFVLSKKESSMVSSYNDKEDPGDWQELDAHLQRAVASSLADKEG